MALWGAEDVWGSSASDIWYIITDQKAGLYNTNAYPMVDGENIVLVHEFPKIAHWNGKSLCKTNLNRFFPKGDKRLANKLLSIWGSAADDVWIGGEAGLLLHWDGRSWSVAPSPTERAIYDLVGARANLLYALASGGYIFRWDGSDWAPTTRDVPVNFRRIWLDQQDRVWGLVEYSDGLSRQDCDIFSDNADGAFRCRLTYHTNLTFPTEIGGFGNQPWVIFRTPPRSNEVLTLPNGEGDEWTIYRLPVANVFSVKAFSADDIWLGAEAEFLRLAGDGFVSVPAPDLVVGGGNNRIVQIQGPSSSSMWGRLADPSRGAGGFLGDGETFRRY